MSHILSFKLFESIESKALSAIFNFLSPSEKLKVTKTIKMLLRNECRDFPLSKLTEEHIQYLSVKKALDYGIRNKPVGGNLSIAKLWFNDKNINVQNSGIDGKSETITNLADIKFNGGRITFDIRGNVFEYSITYRSLQAENARAADIWRNPNNQPSIFGLLGIQNKMIFAKTYFGYEPIGTYRYMPCTKAGDIYAIARFCKAMLMLQNGRKPYEALDLKPNKSYNIANYEKTDEKQFHTLKTGDMVFITFKNRRAVVAQIFKSHINESIYVLQADRGSRDMILLRDFYIDHPNIKSSKIIPNGYMSMVGLREIEVEKEVEKCKKCNGSGKVGEAECEGCKDTTDYTKMDKIIDHEGVTTHTKIREVIDSFSISWAIVMDLNKIRNSGKNVKSANQLGIERDYLRKDTLALRNPKEISAENLNKYLMKISDIDKNDPVLSIFNSIHRITGYDKVLRGLVKGNILRDFEKLFILLTYVVSEKPGFGLNDVRIHFKYIVGDMNKFNTDMNLIDQKGRSSYTPEVLKLIDEINETSSQLSLKLKDNNKDILSIERSILILKSINDTLLNAKYSELKYFIQNFMNNHSTDFRNVMNAVVINSVIDNIREQNNNLRELINRLFA